MILAMTQLPKVIGKIDIETGEVLWLNDDLESNITPEELTQDHCPCCGSYEGDYVECPECGHGQ